MKRTLDPDELAARMAAMVDDVAMVVPFVEVYGDRLAGAVSARLRALGRGDLIRDRDEMHSLVWDVALLIQQRAGAWRPGGALPWTWARLAIDKLVADHIGHARADVDFDTFEPRPVATGPGGSADVDLGDLTHPVAILLRQALDTIVLRDRDRRVHEQYRQQTGDGDPSPAHTVAAQFGIRAELVRQIDRRTRAKLAALAAGDDKFAPLRDLPWVTGRRPPPAGSPETGMAA
jgi:hypothetical protein